MTKEQFFARKSPVKAVTLGDGATVHIRKLSQAEFEHARANFRTEDKAAAGMRWMVGKAVVDENGTRVFEDADQTALQAVEYDDIETIAAEIVELSGLNRVREPKKL